jgi:hypothetical protein
MVRPGVGLINVYLMRLIVSILLLIRGQIAGMRLFLKVQLTVSRCRSPVLDRDVSKSCQTVHREPWPSQVTGEEGPDQRPNSNSELPKRPPSWELEVGSWELTLFLRSRIARRS